MLMGQTVAWLKIGSVGVAILIAIGLLVRLIERLGRSDGNQGS